MTEGWSRLHHSYTSWPTDLQDGKSYLERRRIQLEASPFLCRKGLWYVIWRNQHSALKEVLKRKAKTIVWYEFLQSVVLLFPVRVVASAMMRHNLLIESFTECCIRTRWTFYPGLCPQFSLVFRKLHNRTLDEQWVLSFVLRSY